MLLKILYDEKNNKQAWSGDRKRGCTFSCVIPARFKRDPEIAKKRPGCQSTLAL